MSVWRLRGLSTFSIATLAILGGVIILTCLFVVGGADPEEDDEKNDPAHGLGHHITWVGLKEGLISSEKEDKPLMLIIHKSWCGACRALKPKIKESKEMGELSKNFVMVNTLDDEEPEDELYKPDGGYIPRILFFNPKGELLKDVINEAGSPQYKYYYYDVDGILSSMNNVVKMIQSGSEDGNDNQEEQERKDNQNNDVNESVNSSDKIEL